MISYPHTFLSYIDPNSGGWLFQMLFPIIVAITGTFIVAKKRLVNFFRRMTQRGKGKPPGEE